MESEHNSYLAEKIILYPVLLFISFIKNSIPVIFIFTFMWLIHYNIKIPSLLARISSYMVVMLPISSLCTSFFIVKTVVMHDIKMIKSKFLYFMKLFLNYYPQPRPPGPRKNFSGSLRRLPFVPFIVQDEAAPVRTGFIGRICPSCLGPERVLEYHGASRPRDAPRPSASFPLGARGFSGTMRETTWKKHITKRQIGRAHV